MCVYLCVCVVHTCAKDATVRIADMFTAAMKSLQSSASTIHIVARLFFILHAPMSIHTHKIMQTYADSVPAPTPAAQTHTYTHSHPQPYTHTHAHPTLTPQQPHPPCSLSHSSTSRFISSPALEPNSSTASVSIRSAMACTDSHQRV